MNTVILTVQNTRICCSQKLDFNELIVNSPSITPSKLKVKKSIASRVISSLPLEFTHFLVEILLKLNGLSQIVQELHRAIGVVLFLSIISLCEMQIHYH